MKKFFCFFIFILISSNNCLPQSEDDAVNRINSSEFKDLISQKGDNVIILDVRTLAEFQESHIDNSVNIDMLRKDFKDNLSKLDKSKTYLVYCEVGVRSSKASNILYDSGFTNVYNLSGGIVDWIAKGYPVVE